MMETSCFNDIVERVYAKAPLNKKKLMKYLSTQDDVFFSEAEAFAVKYNIYLQHYGIPLDYAVDAYLEMNKNMMLSQIEFMKTGHYPVKLQTEAYAHVYSNEKAMRSYMIGLAISQFLWATHFEMFQFHNVAILKYKDTISNYLEIGPGHGLFLNRALDHLNKESKIVAVDISPVSMEISKSILSFFRPDLSTVQFIVKDILEYDAENKFDFITMGEVLEHVNEPEKLLLKMKKLLNPEGRAFVSTCVNAPSIDHVYHFKFVEEIQQMLDQCGFAIEDEAILPVEELPFDEIVNKKITINYCALLKHK